MEVAWTQLGASRQQQARTGSACLDRRPHLARVGFALMRLLAAPRRYRLIENTKRTMRTNMDAVGNPGYAKGIGKQSRMSRLACGWVPWPVAPENSHDPTEREVSLVDGELHGLSGWEAQLTSTTAT